MLAKLFNERPTLADCGKNLPPLGCGDRPPKNLSGFGHCPSGLSVARMRGQGPWTAFPTHRELPFVAACDHPGGSSFSPSSRWKLLGILYSRDGRTVARCK